MKGHCPNCKRQPVSNALAASISEPASHGFRPPARGHWEDLLWLTEPGTSKDPGGTEPKVALTWSRLNSPPDPRVTRSLVCTGPQFALLQNRPSLPAWALGGSSAQSQKLWVTALLWPT